MMTASTFLFHAVVIGVGATAFMDLVAVLRRRLFRVPSLDYALLGRWIGHLPRGELAHASIADASPVPGETVLGWTAHYAIGVTFAGLLLAIWGVEWARDPSLAPALIVGLATLVAPFLILQPAFGAGIAASRTPRPWVARTRSAITHLSFGIGLYLAAVAAARLHLA